MKLLASLAAGAIAITAMAAPAAAQRTVVHTRTVVRHGHNWHHARRKRVVCRTYWHHHHRMRRCRTVYY